MIPVVVDTNVFIAALSGKDSANREVIRRCLKKEIMPLMGAALLGEYEDVTQRAAIFKNSVLTVTERDDLFNAFLSVCEWRKIYFTWRPNPRDEGDNHIVELALAGNAQAIITSNLRDFRGVDLKFSRLGVMTAADFLRGVK